MAGRERLALIAAASVGVQVGAATVASRFALAETDPITLAMLRYAVGFLCLAPFAFAAGGFKFARRDVVPIAMLGIGQFGLLIALLNFGLLYIPAGRAALVLAAFPLLTMVFAWLLGREALTVAKTIGVLVTIAGVGLALGENALTSVVERSWIGEAAVLGAAACGAVCSVLYRPYVQRYSALSVGAFAMLASVVALALAAAAHGTLSVKYAFSTTAWSAVIFIGVSSGIFYYLWLWALAHTSPTKVTVFLGLSPITAAALGLMFFSEPLTATFIAGICCVALGLWVALWPKD
jgi:drug/metabolite transporter (DMT)-like permease